MEKVVFGTLGKVDRVLDLNRAVGRQIEDEIPPFLANMPADLVLAVDGAHGEGTVFVVSLLHRIEASARMGMVDGRGVSGDVLIAAGTVLDDVMMQLFTQLFHVVDHEHSFENFLLLFAEESVLVLVRVEKSHFEIDFGLTTRIHR